MKIERIDLYWVKLPLIYPWRTAYGEDWDIHSALVRLEAEGGLYGWGETTPLYAPTYSPENTPGVFYTLREHFVPRVLGQDIASASDLLERLLVFKGNQFAKWQASKHAKAFATLASEKSLAIAKEKGLAKAPQESPECLKCHVTGHGKAAELVDVGFAKEDGVGCESCHGAGMEYMKMVS